MNVDLNKLTTQQLKELRRMIDQRLRDYDLGALSPERVKEVVCFNCCVDDEELSTRMREAVMAKVIISSILIELGYTHKVIGELVGQDHATVSHYKDILADWRAYPNAYRRELRLFELSKKQCYEINNRTI